MLNENPVTGRNGQCLVLGRGAIAIRLALSQSEHKDGYVLVPANICYAAVLPVIYSGYKPLFCDVDPLSGNVTLDTVSAVSDPDIVAAVIPHMYGNPVKDFPEIYRYLNKKNVTVIEDCASLMTNTGNDYVPGTIGDYVVYSTGYSKTIDIGYGGLLFSEKKDLHRAEALEQEFSPYSETFEEEWSCFSAVYRVLRNHGQETLTAKGVYQNLPEVFYSSFSHKTDVEKKAKILECIKQLDQVIHDRRKQYQTYLQVLKLPDEKVYQFGSDAVPWRFNLLLGDERKDFIKYCLENRLPVSDWYPLVTPVFGETKVFPGAEWHEQHIVNFPLIIPEENISLICEKSNQFYSVV